MKSSRYNCIVRHLNGTEVFFNCLTERHFTVSPEHTRFYEEVIADPDEYVSITPDFIGKLKCNGFIVDDIKSESQALQNKYERLLNPGLYEMMILPTYQCNLRCWYCTQKHSAVKLDSSLKGKIKKRIQKVIQSPSESGIQDVLISWFGGEPTLMCDEILEINHYCQSLCEEKKMGFHGHITTNGTTLTPERILTFKEAGISSYQITIDGSKSVHDKIKKLPIASAYETTLTSVAEIAKHTPVILRFNYTADNFEPDVILSQVNARITPGIRHNITFALHKVWQEDQNAISLESVFKMAREIRSSGYQCRLPYVSMCYADLANFDCIFPNGRIGKCDNHPLNELPGVLLDDGSITWENPVKYHTLPFVDREAPCRQCRYLPICWGPCVSKRKRMDSEHGRIVCQYADPDESMAKNILSLIINEELAEG